MGSDIPGMGLLIHFVWQESLVLSTVPMARVLMETIDAGEATLFNLTSNNQFYVYVVTYVTIYILLINKKNRTVCILH